MGSQKERATASTKKTAKQEAARKLLLRLDPSITDSNANLDIVNLNGAQNAVNSNEANTNIPLDLKRLDKETLENRIQKFGIKILDCVTNKDAIAEISEKAKSLYLECTDRKHKAINQKFSTVKDFHTLFEKNYSSKIQDSMRQKMRIIRENYSDRRDLVQMIQDIESSLDVKIQQITVRSREDHIICLRLLSTPCITQFGMGKTKLIAESRAMFNLIKAILMFLNIF